MAIPHRKRMRLKEWDYSQSAVYIVTICIADRTHRLGSITEDDQVVLSDAGRMVEQEILSLPSRHPEVDLDEFVIMPNHIHLLLGLNLDLRRKATVSLSDVIGELKSRTTNRYIRGVKMGLVPRFDQHLWQVDYYETIMRNEKWTEERRAYIANNPANWQDDPDMLPIK